MTGSPPSTALESRAQQEGPPQPRARMGRRRLMLVMILLLVVSGSAAAWWRWRDAPLAQLPVIGLSGVHPDVAATIQQARKGVLESPRSGEAWGHLAMVLKAHNFDPEALACFRMAEHLAPLEFRWPYYQGGLLEPNDREAAGDAYRRAVQKRGNLASIRLTLARFLIDLGQLKQAEAELKIAGELDPENLRLLLLRGYLAQQQGRFSESLRWAMRAITIDPNLREGHRLLAQVYHRLGDPESAQKHMDFLQQLPEESVALSDPFEADIERLRQDPLWKVAQGESLVKSGRTAEGITALQKAIVENPQEERFPVRLANALIRLKAYQKAAIVLDQALERHPDSSQLHFQRGLVYFFQKEWQKAVTQFRRTIRLKPDCGPAYFSLGHSFLELKNPEAALPAFQNAVRSEPDMANAHLNIGRLLWESDRSDEAARHLRMALQLEPHNTEAQKLLEKLSPQ